jgi:glycosyltransferase involved in cell wall biosynthesis
MSAIDLRPRLGRWSAAKTRERFLFVCFFEPSGITTVYENIAMWQQFSCYRIDILNLWPLRYGALMLPPTIDMNDYAGLIIHCTASYHPDNLYSLDQGSARPLREYDGVKILMKQDEHYHTQKFAKYIGEKQLDLVLTCVSADEREKVYPRAVVGEADFLQVFTGYVSPFMQTVESPPLKERPLDIGYRGSIQPLSFGRLGFEKRKIGYDVARAAAKYPITVDISSQKVDRIGGTAWFDFLGRSRAVLGVESATNLFDFNGEVELWCRAFETAYPQADHSSEAFYNDAHRAYLHKFEGNVKYAQISPRHLEAAATRSLQILYEGEYSGLLVAGRHFVPLRRDMANFDQVLDFLADDRRVLAMVTQAYEEIVLDPRLHYAAFVEQFDAAVENALARKGRVGSSAQIAVHGQRPRALVLAGHEPTLDPRIDWMAGGLANDFEVCELGVHPLEEAGRCPNYQRLSDYRVRARVDRYCHDPVIVPHILKLTSSGSIALQHIRLLQVLARLPAKALAHEIGALDATEEDLARFRWYARHYADTNCALLRAGRLTGEFDAIVAADMGTLPVALALSDEYGAKVIYDAHEFWPYSLMEFRHWEVEFWSAFDRNLAQRADLRVTVSPQLADIMEKEYGCDFLTVPNCVSRSSVPSLDIDEALQRFASRKHVMFIFLGGFNDGRGIEDLITAWAHVDPRALLLLQGPDNSFKSRMIELARGKGMLDKSIFFPPAVETAQLLNAARQADVGIIPYAPSSINNRYCCPNKLSQYMAAGLAIISNQTDFVKGVIDEAGIGMVVDFKDHQAFKEVIRRFVIDRDTVMEMARRAHNFFRTTFNWEVASREMYTRLMTSIGERKAPLRAPLDFSWAVEAGGSKMSTASGRIPDAAAFYEQEVTRLGDLNETYRHEIDRLNAVLAPMRTATTPVRYALRQWRQMKQRRMTRA